MEPPEIQAGSTRADQQRARRLSNRTCGHCGEPAAAMLTWGRQQIAICSSCQLRLDGQASPWCGFYEVHPLELRPRVQPTGIIVEARLLPAPPPVEDPRPRSFIGRLIRAALKPFSSRVHRASLPAVPAESD